MTASLATRYAADLLDESGRSGFRTARVARTSIRLRTPAAALNAADYLRSHGVDARAEYASGWAVEVQS